MQTAPETQVKQPTQIPANWNMATPQGNQSMKRKAQSLVGKIEKASASGDHMKVLGAIAQYLKSYTRACKTSTCKGGDTDEARASVYNFVVDVATKYSVSEETVKELWQNT